MTAAGSRRSARERALALLYEAEAKSEAPASVIDHLPIEPDPYADRLVRGVERHGAEIDALLSRYARGWKLERMPAVDRAVLRVAVYELLAEPGVPTAAVVSEAVELASQYSTDESGRFVNGLLARIAIETRGGEAPAVDLPPPSEPVEEFELEPGEEPPLAPPTGPPDADEDEGDADVAAATAPEPRPEAPDAPSEPVDEAPARPAPPIPLPPPLGDGVVRLRPWQPADAPALAAAWADPDVARWSPPPARHGLVDAKRWIAGTPRLRERGLALDLVIASIGPRSVVLGEVGLSDFDDDGGADIGYWVAAEHRGKGHATRAVRLLTAWALNQHGLRQVRATVDPANRASLGVLRRAGYHAATPTLWVAG